MKRQWYHGASDDGFAGFFFGTKEEVEEQKDPTWFHDIYTYGPFKTFAKAKKDAIEYYQIDITTARIEISKIKSERAKGLK